MTTKSYAYYPGCVAHSSAKEYDTSARLVAQSAGIELKELKDWVCCGASAAHSLSQLLGIALPAKALYSAEQTGLPLVTSCAACFSRLKITSHELENEETRKLVSDIIGKKIDNTVQVLHLLQVLNEVGDLPVKRPLDGVKVACYYGCLLVRPPDVASIDDKENPQIMDRLLKRVGAETLGWDFKTECCGAGFPISKPEVMLHLAHRIVSQAKQVGADCISVACPMCHSNLDSYQPKLKAKFGDSSIPIVYFTQLMGLAMGYSAKELKLGKHLTDTSSLLKAKGLA